MSHVTSREAKTTILINQEPHHLDSTHLGPEDFRRLAGLPDEYEVWRVVKSPDPEGQLPVDDEQVTSMIEVTNGDRFRVVPPGTFG